MRRAWILVPAVLVAFHSGAVVAQWAQEGTPICTAQGRQDYHQIVSDGSGGAIIAWVDERSGTTSDIYAQRINSQGQVMWTLDGVGVCIADRQQVEVAICPDGMGGAVIAWADYRTGNGYDILAQRVDADGNRLWMENGIGICIVKGSQHEPELIQDGVGGVIIVWQDWRQGADKYDIYAQRVRLDGLPLWTANGSAVCAEAGYQERPRLASDGQGGAIITWYDWNLDSSECRVYAQRMQANGWRMWAPAGVAVSQEGGTCRFPEIASDGYGGAVIVWNKITDGGWEVHAQKLGANGNGAWGQYGMPVCTAYGEHRYPQVVSDGNGGAIVAWYGRSNSLRGAFGQRISAEGAPMWLVDGISLGLDGAYFYEHWFTADGKGGAFLAGYDYRSGTADIYGQSIDGDGSILWASGGVPVCVAEGARQNPCVTPTGDGSLIVAWLDYRSGERDIYAGLARGEEEPIEVGLDIRPHICPNLFNPKGHGIIRGAIPGTAEFDVSSIDPATVELEGVSPVHCRMNDLISPAGDLEECECVRTRPDGIGDLVLIFRVDELAEAIGEPAPWETVELTVTGSLYDGKAFEGSDCILVMGRGPWHQRHHRWMLTTTLDSGPSDIVQRISYYLPEGGSVEISVYDVSGRRIKRFTAPNQSAGDHTFEWDTAGLASGVYFCRFVSSGQSETKKVPILR